MGQSRNCKKKKKKKKLAFVKAAVVKINAKLDSSCSGDTKVATAITSHCSSSGSRGLPAGFCRVADDDIYLYV